jgi:hypothetical protein
MEPMSENIWGQPVEIKVKYTPPSSPDYFPEYYWSATYRFNNRQCMQLDNSPEKVLLKAKADIAIQAERLEAECAPPQVYMYTPLKEDARSIQPKPKKYSKTIKKFGSWRDNYDLVFVLSMITVGIVGMACLALWTSK